MDESKYFIAIEKDFQRKVYSILGLPFDALCMDDAVACVYSAIETRQPCFISTPNLNFLIASQSYTAFRQSVVNSDLSMVDGMPLIWIARLLGIPLRERLAGSGLIEELMYSGSTEPVKVFFFGGIDGVADLACKKLAEKSCGIHCAGSLNPGFGSIEEMSEPGIIEKINQSDADFVIVSLGAKKGQEWIERNRHRLDAPVISHLGAVVNFVAGTIDRAPHLWQRIGMEWLWRIKEEPVLLNRYIFDGLNFIKLLFTHVFPYVFLIRRNQRGLSSALPFSMVVRESNGNKTVTISGAVTTGQLQVVRDMFITLVPGKQHICIKLDHTAHIDPSFCGLVLILYKHVSDRLTLEAISASTRKVLMFNGVDFLLDKSGDG